MKVIDPLQDFFAPLLDHYQLNLRSKFLDVLTKTATCDDFSNKVDLIFLFTDPGSDEPVDVVVMQFFNQFDLRPDSWSL